MSVQGGFLNQLSAFILKLSDSKSKDLLIHKSLVTLRISVLFCEI